MYISFAKYTIGYSVDYGTFMDWMLYVINHDKNVTNL